MEQYKVKYKQIGASVVFTHLVMANNKGRAEYLAKQQLGQDIILCGTTK